jgi:peroxiredoxin
MARSVGLGFIVLVGIAWMVQAGEYNPVLSVGDAAPTWKDLPGTDGKMHASAELDGKDVIVVAFLCCSCPAVADYEERLIAFANKHAKADSKVGIVAINVNTIEEDRLAAMTERAKEKKYPFPYLYDASQKIGRQFGASYTPEFFVLDKNRKIAYMGAFDDRDDASKATKHFVEDAVRSLLAGEKVKTGETLGRGCRVRYNRAKKGS